MTTPTYTVGPRGKAGRGIIIGEGLPPTDQDILKNFIVGSGWFDKATGKLYGPLAKVSDDSNDLTFGDPPAVIYTFAQPGGGGGGGGLTDDQVNDLIDTALVPYAERSSASGFGPVTAIPATLGISYRNAYPPVQPGDGYYVDEGYGYVVDGTLYWVSGWNGQNQADGIDDSMPTAVKNAYNRTATYLPYILRVDTETDEFLEPVVIPAPAGAPTRDAPLGLPVDTSGFQDYAGYQWSTLTLQAFSVYWNKAWAKPVLPVLPDGRSWLFNQQDNDAASEVNDLLADNLSSDSGAVPWASSDDEYSSDARGPSRYLLLVETPDDTPISWSDLQNREAWSVQQLAGENWNNFRNWYGNWASDDGCLGLGFEGGYYGSLGRRVFFGGGDNNLYPSDKPVIVSTGEPTAGWGEFYLNTGVQVTVGDDGVLAWGVLDGPWFETDGDLFNFQLYNDAGYTDLAYTAGGYLGGEGTQRLDDIPPGDYYLQFSCGNAGNAGMPEYNVAIGLADVDAQGNGPWSPNYGRWLMSYNVDSGEFETWNFKPNGVDYTGFHATGDGKLYVLTQLGSGSGDDPWVMDVFDPAVGEGGTWTSTDVSDAIQALVCPDGSTRWLDAVSGSDWAPGVQIGRKLVWLMETGLRFDLDTGEIDALAADPQNTGAQESAPIWRYGSDFYTDAPLAPDGTYWLLSGDGRMSSETDPDTPVSVRRYDPTGQPPDGWPGVGAWSDGNVDLITDDDSYYGYLKGYFKEDHSLRILGASAGLGGEFIRYKNFAILGDPVVFFDSQGNPQARLSYDGDANRLHFEITDGSGGWQNAGSGSPVSSDLLTGYDFAVLSANLLVSAWFGSPLQGPIDWPGGDFGVIYYADASGGNITIGNQDAKAFFWVLRMDNSGNTIEIQHVYIDGEDQNFSLENQGDAALFYKDADGSLLKCLVRPAAAGGGSADGITADNEGHSAMVAGNVQGQLDQADTAIGSLFVEVGDLNAASLPVDYGSHTVLVSGNVQDELDSADSSLHYLLPIVEGLDGLSISDRLGTLEQGAGPTIRYNIYRLSGGSDVGATAQWDPALNELVVGKPWLEIDSGMPDVFYGASLTPYQPDSGYGFLVGGKYSDGTYRQHLGLTYSAPNISQTGDIIPFNFVNASVWHGQDGPNEINKEGVWIGFGYNDDGPTGLWGYFPLDNSGWIDAAAPLVSRCDNAIIGMFAQDNHAMLYHVFGGATAPKGDVVDNSVVVPVEDSHHIYDPSTDTWSVGAPMPGPLIWCTAVTSAVNPRHDSGHPVTPVHVFGIMEYPAVDTDNFDSPSSTERQRIRKWYVYHPDTDTWEDRELDSWWAATYTPDSHYALVSSGDWLWQIGGYFWKADGRRCLSPDQYAYATAGMDTPGHDFTALRNDNWAYPQAGLAETAAAYQRTASSETGFIIATGGISAAAYNPFTLANYPATPWLGTNGQGGAGVPKVAGHGTIFHSLLPLLADQISDLQSEITTLQGELAPPMYGGLTVEMIGQGITAGYVQTDLTPLNNLPSGFSPQCIVNAPDILDFHRAFDTPPTAFHVSVQAPHYTSGTLQVQLHALIQSDPAAATTEHVFAHSAWHNLASDAVYEPAAADWNNDNTGGGSLPVASDGGIWTPVAPPADANMDYYSAQFTATFRWA